MDLRRFALLLCLPLLLGAKPEDRANRLFDLLKKEERASLR